MSDKFKIIESIIDKAYVTALFDALNIVAANGLNIIQEIKHSQYNKSALIRIPDQSCSSETDIFLNIKQGQPTVDQVYNAIYQLGADCQNRIIAFTGGQGWDDEENPGADIDKVRSLVETMNEYDQGIYMVQISSDSTSSEIECEVLAKPNAQPKFSKAECPTKERFTESELWQIHFWSVDDIFQELAFQSGFDPDRQYGLYLQVGGLGIDTKWNDDGALILVTDANTNDNKLESIWDTNKDEIFEMFKGCDTKLLYSSGRLKEISITVFYKPISDLTGVRWREKSCYAGLLFSKYMQFEGFIEKALQDQKK